MCHPSQPTTSPAAAVLSPREVHILLLTWLPATYLLPAAYQGSATVVAMERTHLPSGEKRMQKTSDEFSLMVRPGCSLAPSILSPITSIALDCGKSCRVFREDQDTDAPLLKARSVERVAPLVITLKDIFAVELETVCVAPRRGTKCLLHGASKITPRGITVTS